MNPARYSINGRRSKNISSFCGATVDRSRVGVYSFAAITVGSTDNREFEPLEFSSKRYRQDAEQISGHDLGIRDGLTVLWFFRVEPANAAGLDMLDLVLALGAGARKTGGQG